MTGGENPAGKFGFARKGKKEPSKTKRSRIGQAGTLWGKRTSQKTTSES